MSNMNMKIIINKKNKIKNKRWPLLDKTNINKYILPSFTKKYLIQYRIKMKSIAIIEEESRVCFANLLEKMHLSHIKFMKKTH